MSAHPTVIAAPRGVWLGASLRYGAPCPVSEPYPHVCTQGAQRRDCAACAEDAQRSDVKYWDY